MSRSKTELLEIEIAAERLGIEIAVNRRDDARRILLQKEIEVARREVKLFELILQRALASKEAGRLQDDYILQLTGANISARQTLSKLVKLDSR